MWAAPPCTHFLDRWFSVRRMVGGASSAIVWPEHSWCASCGSGDAPISGALVLSTDCAGTDTS